MTQTIEVYEDEGGEHRWRLRAGNSRIVADSSEGYASKSGAREAAERVQNHAPSSDTLAVGEAAFEVYEDKRGAWRWRLVHRNGNIVADGGEGYDSRSGAMDAVERFRARVAEAETRHRDG